MSTRTRSTTAPPRGRIVPVHPRPGEAMAWTTAGTTPADAERITGPGCGTRVHAASTMWFSGTRLRNAVPSR